MTIKIQGTLFHQHDNKDGYFIGVDRGCLHLLKQGIVPAFGIGDFDSVTKEELAYIESFNFKLIKLSPQKDVNDLEACLHYIEQGPVEIYGAIQKRMDHFLTHIKLLERFCHLKIRLIDEYNVIEIIETGAKFDYPYKYYSFFAFEPTLITLKGFKYPLYDYLITKQDTLCLSNEIDHDPVIICDHPVLLVNSK